MQHDVLADNFSQGTLVKEKGCKLLQIIERHIGSIRPVEGKLIAAVRIVGKIAGIHSIGYDEKLDVVKQTMERSLVVTLNLVVCLFEFHPSAFQFDLNQGQAIDEYRYIIAALFSSFHCNLIGDLKLVLAPVGTVQKLHPHPFTAFQFKRIQVAQFFGFFKTGTSFQVNQNLFKLCLCKGRTSEILQSFFIVLFKLSLEIGIQVFLFINLNIFIAHLLKSSDKSIFERCFTL